MSTGDLPSEVLPRALARNTGEQEKIQLAALLDIGQILSSSLNEAEILNRILDVAREVMGAEISSLRLLDPDTGMLHVAAQRGLDLLRSPLRLGESVVGVAVAEKRPVVVSKIEGSTYKHAKVARQLGLRGLVSVPLLLKDRVLGAYYRISRLVDDEGYPGFSAATHAAVEELGKARQAATRASATADRTSDVEEELDGLIQGSTQKLAITWRLAGFGELANEVAP